MPNLPTKTFDLEGFAISLVKTIVKTLEALLNQPFKVALKSHPFDVTFGFGPDGRGRIRSDSKGINTYGAVATGIGQRKSHVEAKGAGMPSLLWVGLGGSPAATVRDVAKAVIAAVAPEPQGANRKALDAALLASWTDTHTAAVLATVQNWPDYSFGRTVKSNPRTRFKCSDPNCGVSGMSLPKLSKAGYCWPCPNPECRKTLIVDSPMTDEATAAPDDVPNPQEVPAQ